MRPISINEGQRFGRLIVIEEVDGQEHRCFRCECDCGRIKDVRLSHLTMGKVLSCGCYSRDRKTKHGMYGSSIYRRWNQMLQRCENPNSKEFHNYGGRGIKVCKRWHDFRNFVADVGLPSQPDYELDRIDNDRGYEPGNIRWTTQAIQIRNQRKRLGCSSHYRGVCWNAQRQKWQAEIKVATNRRHLGHFKNEEDAARAYDAVAKLYKGFTLNFPEGAN
jgi:AP2 domain